MYSDYEVTCLYLGKPFEERILHAEGLIPLELTVSERDIENARSTLPLLAQLVEAASSACR